MGIDEKRGDNLAALLDGVSLLDDRDKERFIGVVDILTRTDRAVGSALFSDDTLLNVETSSAYADEKI